MNYIALTCWCLLVVVLQSLPGGTYPSQPFPYFDKVMHLLLYLPMGYLAARVRYQAALVLVPVWAIGFSGAFGIMDEIHQVWIPQRSPSLSDWVADCVGGCFGAYMRLYQHHFPLLEKLNTALEVRLIKHKE